MHIVYHPLPHPLESIVFNFSWDGYNTQGELKIWLGKIWGNTKCIMNNVELVTVVSYIPDVPASLV